MFPAQWDVRNQTWRRYYVEPGTDWWAEHYPADQMQRPTGPLCDGCHSVNYDIKKKTVTEWNVGCEKCHGAGSLHVEFPIASTIVNPAKLDGVRAGDVCIQCHSQGQPRTKPIDGVYYDWPVGYQPGDRLSDVWMIEEHHLGKETFTHWPDGHAHKNRMQGNDYVQSQMSVKGVRCDACHDVHGTPNQALLRQPGDAGCLSCHGPQLQPGPRARSNITPSTNRVDRQQLRRVPHAPDRPDGRQRERAQPYVQVHFAGHDRTPRRAKSVHVLSYRSIHHLGHRRAQKVAERIPVARGRVAGCGEVATSPSRSAGWIAGLLLVPMPAAAQNEPRCAFLCAPELKIEPTWTIENLVGPSSIEIDGQVERASRENVFELIFALDVPTTIPRVSLTFEAIFVPFGATTVHPFTGATAAEAGRREIRDNGIEIETELNFHLFRAEQTGGWVSSHVDIVDKFSPGETPRAASVYTHKLNFEWDTAFHVFNRLPQAHWLRNVEAEVSLDYVATGLPKAGDVIARRTVSDQGESVVVVVRHDRSPGPSGPVRD